MILVANKTDLEGSRAVKTSKGKKVSTLLVIPRGIQKLSVTVVVSLGLVSPGRQIRVSPQFFPEITDDFFLIISTSVTITSTVSPLFYFPLKNWRPFFARHSFLCFHSGVTP